MAKLNLEITPLSGRSFEKSELRKLLTTTESELVAVYGRRRIGKTFLVKKAYEKELVFRLTGINEVTKEEQLENFARALNAVMNSPAPIAVPSSWGDAFEILKVYLKRGRSKRKKVLFFDEFPWLASPRSGFMQAFDHFWNTWAVDQNLIVVICGSAAAWMIKRVVNSRGGLHNRVTKRIHLQPFTLGEVETYFSDRKLSVPRYDMLQLYMALGGVPFYLRMVEKGQSAIQAIDKICFGKRALLRDEFDNLYRSLFSNYEDHIEVIRALNKKRKGLTRQELIDITSLRSGGGLTIILNELEESSFISSYDPWSKKARNKLYRLTDEFSAFYLSYMERHGKTNGYWIKNALSPKVKSWSGYVFESICFKHIEEIKRALQIAGIDSTVASMVHKGNAEVDGFQIDLLIDRADNAINLCEAKYYNGPYIITKAQAEKLRERRALFVAESGTKKQVITTLITTYGVHQNVHKSTADQVVTMDSLFLA